MRELVSGPAVLISDQGLARAGLADQVGDLIGAGQRLTFLEGEPSAAEVNRAAEVLRDAEVTVVGLGGGSALDLAKLAASVSQGQLDVDAYGACARPLPPSLPTVLIPTTAGTGSEMTRTAVFADSQGRKTWAWGDELQAEHAVLDPELTLGLPRLATVLTAVDALSHALEAATAVNKTSLTYNLCQQAVAMIPEALEQTLASPGDITAREQLLNASGLAGIALNSCGTGLAHALAHALGSLVKVPHGLAIAWSLRTTVRWNPAECYAGFDWLADGPAAALENWLDKLQLPPLPAFESAELAAALRLPENVPMLENNARPVDPDEIEALSRDFQTNFGRG
ncbi:MAG: iron-containing alcohol dehydrogenase [Candidatus Eremiobacteraeota bacterium]|nr:iron-containing alcohol dehydrogenase [Candidatus Eremiobacteraeota bacterium]